MKNAIARIMLMLVLALAVVFVSACGNTPDGTPGDGTQGGGLDGGDETNENLTDWSVEAVYARAVTYGYEGSLEEFVELVSGKDGKDGVGIQSLSIVDGSLAVVLTDGKVIDAGPVSGPAGVGIEKTEINENDELIVYYTDGTSDNLGKIVGEKGNDGEAGKDGKDGEKGKDGVGIEKIEMNEKNELIIYLTDGTSKNYGPVCTHKGTDSEVYTVAFDSNGGSAVENQYVTRGDKVKIPAEPTKEGAYFDGWWVGEERWSFIGYPVTEDITLTAKWATNAEVKVYAVFNDYSDPETAMEEGVLYSTTPWVLDSDIGLTVPNAWEDGTFIKSISVWGLNGGIILGSEAFDYDESVPKA